MSPNGAVRLLEAGGERAEAELVAAEVLELMRKDVAPEDVAVLSRAPAVLGQVLAGYGIPVAQDRGEPFARTRLGAGLLGLARAALGDGTAADVIAWLRTPGKLPDAAPADALEARVRRNEATTTREARRLWAGAAAAGAALPEIDAVAEAAAAGPAALLDALLAEAEAIWTAPHLRRAAVLRPEERADARAAAALRAAAAELRGLAAEPDLLGGPADVLEALGAVEVTDRAGPTGVLLADPLAIRARRFRAVFVCGLQDGEFPRRPQPEPFLDDDARAALARASGLILRRHEEVLAQERYLLYACVSRPEEVLFLSFRSSDEEGDPLQPSPFVDDVRALFTDELWEHRGQRLLAEVTWPPALAPTPHELRRAQAAAVRDPEPPPLGPPSTPAVLAVLAGREREAARGLETFAACGVKWLVESLLRPARVEPDPEPMRRGSLAHAVLERTLRGLRERTGSARLVPETLDAALAELAAALRELAEAGPRPPGARGRAALRSLQVDLEGYLRHEAECGAGLEPLWLEWSFGGPEDEHGPFALQDTGLAVTGRVDRIDVDARGRGVVRDYKGKTVSAGARWTQDRRLQVALYALAARDRLGLEPAAALYQPLGRSDHRPRGLVRDDVDGRYVNGDVVDEEAFAAALADAEQLAAATARDLLAGRIRPCPERCSPNGCAYPAICRAGEGAANGAGDGPAAADGGAA